MAKTRGRQQGFAIVEALLVLIIIGLVAGIGYWVVTQRNKTATTNDSSTTTTTTTAQPGTTQSIDQLTQQDAQSESSIDSKYQTSEQSTINATNTAQGNIGGAYDETTF